MSERETGYYAVREKPDHPMVTNAWTVALIQEPLTRDGSRVVFTQGAKWGVPFAEFAETHEVGRMLMGDEEFGSEFAKEDPRDV